MKLAGIFVHSAAVAALVLASAGLTATAGAENFYAGKTLQVIVGFGPSSSYNQLSRLVARHIDKHLPGKPTVIVKNMPGAGGIRATNFLYNVARKDGTVIGMIGQSVYQDQLLGTPGLKADVSKFNWIGRIISNNPVLFVWHTAPVQKIQDAYEKELIVSAGGRSSKLRWTMVQNLLGLKFKLISGYKGSGDAMLAMQRGEIDGLSVPWSYLRVQKADWLRDGTIKVILQAGLTGAKDLPNVPTMIELGKNDEQRQILTFFAAAGGVGRSLLAPPDVPEARVAELRAAFTATLDDPGLLAEARKQQVGLDPLNGEELQALVQKSIGYSPDLVAKAKALVE